MKFVELSKSPPHQIARYDFSGALRVCNDRDVKNHKIFLVLSFYDLVFFYVEI